MLQTREFRVEVPSVCEKPETAETNRSYGQVESEVTLGRAPNCIQKNIEKEGANLSLAS